MTMIRAQKHVLMAPNDGNSGGGAGGGGAAGGAGAGGAAGGDGGGGGEEVSEQIKKFVTAAIQGAWKPLESKILKQIPTGDAIKASIAEALKDFKPTGGSEGGAGAGSAGGGTGGGAGAGAGGAGGGTGGGAGHPDTELKLKKLQDAFDAQALQLKKEKETAAAAAEQQARKEERSALTNALLKHGIPEARASASALLFVDRGAISRDDHGQICVTVKTKVGGEIIEEQMPIDAGIAEWVKSAEGKEFLPAVEAGGSGGRQGGRPPKPGEKMNRDQAANVLTGWILGDNTGG